MIVKFKANKKPRTGWLIKDKSYVVLGLQFSCENGNPNVCIKSEDNDTPIIVDIEEFEIVSPNISKDWTFVNHQNGFFSLRPQEFMGDFWDNFHDSDERAEMIFWEVYDKLSKELESLQ